MNQRIRIITLFILLVSAFGGIENVSAQSKKEQIRGLQTRIDSFSSSVDSLKRLISRKDSALEAQAGSLAKLQKKSLEMRQDLEQAQSWVESGNRIIDSLRTSLNTLDDEIIRRKHKEYLMRKDAEITDVSSTVFLTDLDGDQKNEVIVDYCGKTKLSGQSVGGGNIAFPDCMVNGIAVYGKNQTGQWVLKDDKPEEDFYKPNVMPGGFFECAIEGCKDGRINLVAIDYDSEDPRCCPSLEKRYYLALKDGKIYLPEQKPKVTKRAE